MESFSTAQQEPNPSEAAIPTREWTGAVWRRKSTVIAVIAVVAILVHLLLRFAFHTSPRAYQIPLLATLALGGIPLVYELVGSKPQLLQPPM